MGRIQTIVTSLTCDLCGEEGQRTFTIVIDDGERQRSKPRRLDVCEEHAAPIADLQLRIRETGVILTDIPDAMPRTTCPMCGREFTRSDVYAHLRNSHGLKAPPQPARCPDCKRVINGAQMIRHRQASHAYDHLAAYVEHASSGRKAR